MNGDSNSASMIEYPKAIVFKFVYSLINFKDLGQVVMQKINHKSHAS